MKLFVKIFSLLFIPASVIGQQDPYVENWTGKQIDSLQYAWQHTSNDTLRMKISRSLGWHYQEKNRDSSLYFHQQELTLARKLKQKLWEADALDQAGWVLAQLKNYPLSLQYFLDGIKILENKNCEENIWGISLFSQSGNPVNARLTALAFIYNDLSVLYAGAGNLEKEFSSLSRGVQIAKSISNHTILPYIYLNLGGFYFKTGNYDSSLVYEEEALYNMYKSGYKVYEGMALATKGSNYLKKGNYELAKQYFEKSILASHIQNNKTTIPHTYLLLADLYKTIGKNDSGIYYTKKALTNYQQLDLRASVNDCYASLYTLFESTKNADSAFYYLKLYKALNDSVSMDEKKKLNEYQNVGFNEQINQREQENARIEKENTMRTYILVAGILVFMMIAFLLYRNNRIRRKANELLQKQKEEIELQKRNAEQTLSKLKSTQTQLIQSEKMASLGELTAGIAHEIQNPLNFVNNFSDLNTELVDELKEELKSGNIEGANYIADDIRTNNGKISHHGKRAESIVTGMLQHSRTSTGQKEPTDINKLADEYLRLAYHGIRAKEKDFNCKIVTEFGESIGNINIISGDIGRVILNLINNAFYAVNERLRQSPPDSRYEPTVTVNTNKEGNQVSVCVRDNGSGMPQKIIDKIFNPFFTTKPTGQGTGLGLSLSYDIVKAHGGDIKVQSKEGEGTEFIVQLPFG